MGQLLITKFSNKKNVRTIYNFCMAPKVSILIPLYNNEAFIAETIKTGLNQTHTNFEIIIVDDGSTDKSYRIASSYKSELVKLYKQENKGACAARNHAFEKCSGDYIQYLDADDLLSPNKLEAQLKLFYQFGDNIVTNCKWGRFKDNPELVKWEDQPINKDYNNPIDWLQDSWMGNGMAQTASWLTPRHLIEKAGPWDESLLINQDGEFFSRVLMNAKSLKYVNDCGVYYRTGLLSSITQANKQSRAKAESLLSSYCSYNRVLEITDKDEIKMALGNNYLNFLYQYHHLYPDLSQKAEILFRELGFTKMWPVGGSKFKFIAGFIGLKNSLEINTALKKIRKY